MEDLKQEGTQPEVKQPTEAEIVEQYIAAIPDNSPVSEKATHADVALEMIRTLPEIFRGKHLKSLAKKLRLPVSALKSKAKQLAAEKLEAAAEEPQVEQTEAAQYIDIGIPGSCPDEEKGKHTTLALGLILQLPEVVHSGYFRMLAAKLKLDVREVQKQAKLLQAESKSEPEASLFRVGDHAEIAKHLIGQYTDEEIAPVYDEGSLHAYNPEQGVWNAISEDRISRDIQALSGSIVGAGRALSITANLIKGTIACMVARVRRDGFFGLAPRDGVAMRNGYARVTAQGVVCEPHSPQHRQRFLYPFDYVPNQVPTKFVGSLKYAFRDDEDAQQKIDLLQEFVGISRIGQATKYEQAVFLHGPRADDGKSTVLTAIGGSFDPSTVACLSPWEIGDRFRLQELVSKLINVTDDDRSDIITYAGLFKSLVTAKNNNFTYERKGKDTEKFRPIAGHIAAVNTLPRADDNTNGWFRRQVVIQFNNQVEASRKVRSFEAELLAEVQQIVCWTLDGAARCMKQDGYTIPSSSVEAVREWRQHSDSAFLFATEACKEDDSQTVCTTLNVTVQPPRFSAPRRMDRRIRS